MPERVQKLLAAAGMGSRRALEKRIRDGEVIINGQPAQLGEIARREVLRRVTRQHLGE